MCSVEKLYPSVWFVGMSGAGKTTISNCLLNYMKRKNIPSYKLDGDEFRQNISSDLGFSEKDRSENLRRARCVTKILHDLGIFTCVSLMNPFEKQRELTKEMFGVYYLEVFVEAPLDVLRSRDTKGLYKRFRQGEITNMCGLDSKFELPKNCDLILNTAENSEEECLHKLLGLMYERFSI